MLKASRKVHYALLVLIHLAEDDKGEVSSARHIAAAYDLPLPVISNVLKRLVAEGLVKAARGAQGGHRLAAAPRDIPLLAIVEAIEGCFQFSDCVHVPRGRGRACLMQRRNCPARATMHRLHERLATMLREVTLADFLKSR